MPEVSLIIPNWNRKGILRKTLEHVKAIADETEIETIVVDNASSDGAPEMVERDFGWVKLFRLDENIATAARNVGIERARGRYIVMLDNDSYPAAGALTGMLQVFEREADLGVVAFRILLPDGSDDPVGAYNVFTGCGAGFRAALLREVGGYPTDYHYYVEEYDVSFRILQAGYRVAYFRDIVARHEKSDSGRDMNKVLYYLSRNNIKLWYKYLPPESAWPMIADTVERYGMVARRESAVDGYVAGVADGLRALPHCTCSPLSASVLDKALPGAYIQSALAELKRHGVNRLSIWTLGKYGTAFIDAARAVGIEIDRIYDDLLASTADVYRNIPVSARNDLSANSETEVMIGSASLGAIENERKSLKDFRGRVHYLFDYDEADRSE